MSGAPERWPGPGDISDRDFLGPDSPRRQFARRDPGEMLSPRPSPWPARLPILVYPAESVRLVRVDAPDDGEQLRLFADEPQLSRSNPCP